MKVGNGVERRRTVYREACIAAGRQHGRLNALQITALRDAGPHTAVTAPRSTHVPRTPAAAVPSWSTGDRKTQDLLRADRRARSSRRSQCSIHHCHSNVEYFISLAVRLSVDFYDRKIPPFSAGSGRFKKCSAKTSGN